MCNLIPANEFARLHDCKETTDSSGLDYTAAYNPRHSSTAEYWKRLKHTLLIICHMMTFQLPIPLPPPPPDWPKTTRQCIGGAAVRSAISAYHYSIIAAQLASFSVSSCAHIAVLVPMIQHYYQEVCNSLSFRGMSYWWSTSSSCSEPSIGQITRQQQTPMWNAPQSDVCLCLVVPIHSKIRIIYCIFPCMTIRCVLVAKI